MGLRHCKRFLTCNMIGLMAVMMTGMVATVATAATPIQMVKTKGGLTAWLMESHQLPMLSVELNFRAGSAFEPAGKEGLAQFTASLLDEGAGPYDAHAFKDQLEAIGARFGGSSDTMDVSVNLTTLSQHADRAFELMGMAVREPRFDDEAVARVRSQLLANLKRGEEDPATVAWKLLRPRLMGNHPYANDGDGTAATLKAMGRKDLAGWHLANFTRANVQISVVGDISADRLAELLDSALLGLPAGAGRRGAELTPQAASVAAHITRTMPVPQGTVLLARRGLERHDPDFYPFVVMNEIFGGGVLTSRLGLDVREKHGLAYDVRATNRALPGGGMYVINLATDNAKVQKALDLVLENLNAMRDTPVTREEFDDAKSYLIGSFPLRLDSNTKLLNMMAMMQGEGLGVDYMDRWPARIAAVTFDDVQRVAKRVLVADDMVLSVVGQGPALKAQWHGHGGRVPAQETTGDQ